MSRFIDQIAQGISYDSDHVVGYSDDELAKIERMYDIRIVGQFRQFMSEMGRSDGGLLGDDPIILYRIGMSVRRHIMFQLRLVSDFKDYRIENGLCLLKYHPFLFSLEMETQYFFLTTTSENSDIVYHYDENEETVESTGLEFTDYMRKIIEYYNRKFWEYEKPDGEIARVLNARRKIICRGDLLNI